MRLFYAALFDKYTIRRLSEVQESLHPILSRGQYTPKENLHITLHFLGDSNPLDAGEYSDALDIAAEGLLPFDLSLTSFGSFSRKGENLIYLKVESPDEFLRNLATTLKVETGRGDTRPLKPHITLVRRGILSREHLHDLKTKKMDTIKIKIRSLALMESARIDGKLTYIPLHKVQLG